MSEQNGENTYKAFFLSQEVIDGFINDFEAQRKLLDEPEDTAVISQNDIDQLFQTSGNPANPESDNIPPLPSLRESDESDSKPDNSESDIAPLTADLDSEDDKEPSSPPASGTETSGANKEEADSDMVSQSDIDRLLSDLDSEDDKEPSSPPASGTETSGANKEEADSDMVSQSDIDRLLSDLDSEDDKEPSSPPASGTETSGANEEDTDFDMVSQSDIDQLLSELDEDSEAGHVVPETSSEDTLQKARGQDRDEMTPALETGVPEFGETEAEESTLMSDKDIEQLLTNFGWDEEPVASKEGATETSEDEDASQVTQTDIDQLMALASEEKDAPESSDPADIPEKDSPESPLSTHTSKDSVQRAEDDDSPEPVVKKEPLLQTEPAARVVLEETKEAQPEDEKEIQENRTGKLWYAFRKCWVCCGLLLVIFGMASVFVYWLQHTSISSPHKPTQPVVLTFSLQQLSEGRALPDSVPDRNKIETSETESPLIKEEMKRFFVPAPLALPDVAYLEADVVMELSSDAVAEQIRQHEPFFRGIVYDVMSNALTLQKSKADMDASGLQNTIQTALNEALPEKGVRKIRFSRFSLF
jgi:flagellar basal body-associated protein FliL